jgi:signal transduction histidine kinase
VTELGATAGPTVKLPEVPADLWVAFDRATAEVEAGWRQLVDDSPSQEEVRSQLELLRAAVKRAARREAPEAELQRTVLSRRLVELVRRALVDQAGRLSPAPSGGALIALLSAIESVYQTLEPDWAQHFANRLSGPDGMELVVEVAHDLRSPLTSILFLAETLQRGRSGPITSVQERQLGLIYSAAFGLSSLASDVIELARGGDRLVDLDPLPFSVSDIFESVRDIVQPIAEEKGLQVRLHVPEVDFRVGYPVALSRVLLNLTTNALKFTSEGFVELRGDQAEGTRLRFSVQDTGRGIPPTAMLNLFEPFRRRQKQGEYAFSGAGLGLSICRKLVEAMRSTLKVETSPPDTGTRFYFELDLPLASERL